MQVFKVGIDPSCISYSNQYYITSYFISADLHRLLRFTTGSEELPAAGYSPGYISVNFAEGDAIIGATCQMKLTLPTSFDNYDAFKRSLLAVLPDGSKSFTMI